MTDDELDLMERLWRAGMPSKQIARLLGYSDHTIRARASHDRGRFPYRRLTPTPAEREAWVALMLSGDATPADAAAACGVTVACARIWRRDGARGAAR